MKVLSVFPHPRPFSRREKGDYRVTLTVMMRIATPRTMKTSTVGTISEA